MAKASSRRSIVALRGLTIASLKMYFRNRTALFFSLFFPVMFIVVFGFIFKNSNATFKVDVTNQAQSALATQFTEALGKIDVLKVKTVATDQASTDLNKGDTDLTLTIPAGFGTSGPQGVAAAPIIAHYNAARPGNGQAAAQIVSQLANNLNNAITKAPQIVTVAATGVKTKNLSYIDFLLPGMVGLSIMQLGIFSVAFGFISYKTTGMLRRLQATPVHPGNFLAAQGSTRLIMTVVQTIILVAIGMLMFNFHLSPVSWPAFLVLALLGSVVFMAFGFAIAGWAKDENQAAPVAQVIQFPMMFLSGTFFPRDSFPPLLERLTGFLPLTYLADGLRHVANDGASLWAVRGDVLGLVVWGIVSAVIAVRLFRWE
ncbi:MAG TPA: ABC transporter permease [Candidatus Saccharimonadia bacterium]